MIDWFIIPDLENFKRVVVLGPGLLGGSILHAIHHFQSGQKPNSLGVWARRQEPIDCLLEQGIVRHGSTSVSELFSDPETAPDFVILATPIGFMPELARQIADAATTPVIVTDVGSTKANLVATLDSVFESNVHIQFVGSHPMAGSEKTGLDHASADLFENAVCILTPTAKTDASSLEKVDIFWRSLGGKTHHLSPEDHDEVVGKISHLPHISAAALSLAGMKETATGTLPAEFSAGGFRDSTRIAAGHVEMWTEILLENRQTISESLRNLICRLESVHASLENSDESSLRSFLAEAKEKRDTLK
ncbi:MAG: prephenate dehydrogenase [Verrucomicrobiales bacterium]